MQRALKVVSPRLFLYILLLLQSSMYADTYNLSSTPYPPCDTSWSVSGSTYTCSGDGRVTLKSGDIITSSSNATISANKGFTLPGSNTIGTSTNSINLVSDYGTIVIANSTLYGSIQSSSGAITLSSSTLSGNITSHGTTNLTNSNIGGNVSSQNGITTNNTNINGTVTSSNGNIVLTGGTINGKVTSASNTITANGANLMGGATAQSGISISNGTINGAFSLTSNNNFSLDHVTMTSGSISNAQNIIISNSNLGSANSPIDIQANGTITVENSSIVYGNLTAATWGTNVTINKDSSSTIIGTCAPNYGFPCTAASVVEYRMDECSWTGTSGEVKDSSGKNYNATAKSDNGSTPPQVSKQIINIINNSALFQRAKQQYLDIPNLQKDTPNFHDGFTVTTWAQFSGSASGGSWERIFDFGNGVDQNNIFLGRYGTTNDIVLGIHDPGKDQYLIAPDAISDANWHFWAVSCSGDSCSLYKDGANIASSKKMKIPQNITRTSNYIGKSNWSADAYFQGGIDEFKVFDDSLSDAQILTIYTNESAKKNYNGTIRTTGNCILPTCFTDTFDRTSLGSKWSIIKAENYTPNITANKLMLTDKNASIATGVSITGDFPSADNLIEIEFEHNAYGGTGADGVAVVLSDANTTPVAGSYGGSLGYANRTGQSGFAGGWLGFGLDEYGNFSNPTEGRHDGPGFRQDAFAIRGSGSGQTGYNYITGTTSLSPGIDAATALKYKYKLIIDTRNNQTIVSVGRDTNSSGTYTPILSNANASQAATPARYKLSLTGSTGDSNNYHSIDNFSIKALQCGTLGQEQIINNFFDAWDTGASYNINNRKIQTKIVNSSFNLNIASLNEANSDYKDFSGTTCVRVVDSTDNPLTNWSKLLFTASNPTINTVSLQSSSASKDNRIKIKWKKGQDIACDSMVEDNTTKSSDNFAIRPNNFNSTITANQTFFADQLSSIVFQANQFGGTGATNYNESIYGSFKVDVNISDITKTCAVNSIQFSPAISFNDGISASPLYSLPNVGSYTLSMHEIAGAEFAKVDSADTPDAQRYITPYTQTLKVVPSTFLITGTFRNGSNGFTYLSNFEQFATSPNRDISAHLDLNISARSATNALLSNYTALCYAKDANLTLRTNTTGTTLTNLSKVLWYENNHDLNGSVVLENNASYSIPLSTALFNSTTMGMAETNFRINFDRNSTKPVQPFRFTIQDLNTTDTDFASGAITLNQDSVFYYGRVNSTDYRDASPINTTIRYEVYCKDCNRANFNIMGTQSPTSLIWYQNPIHVIADGNVSQFTSVTTGPKATTIANSTTSNINNGFDISHTLTNATAPYVDRIKMTPSAWLLFNLFNASATTNDFNVEFIHSDDGNWSGQGRLGKTVDVNTSTRTNRRMEW